MKWLLPSCLARGMLFKKMDTVVNKYADQAHVLHCLDVIQQSGVINRNMRVEVFLSGRLYYMVKRLSAYGGCLGNERR